MGGEIDEVCLQRAASRQAHRRLQDEPLDESPGENRVDIEADTVTLREAGELWVCRQRVRKWVLGRDEYRKDLRNARSLLKR